jgi:hypothetical protein
MSTEFCAVTLAMTVGDDDDDDVSDTGGGTLAFAKAFAALKTAVTASSDNLCDVSATMNMCYK